MLQGWVFAYSRNLLSRIHNDECNPALAPLVRQWKPPRGFTDHGHYRDVIDSLDHSHVIWRSYERRRDITPFQDICWYSRWIMAANTGGSVTCQSGFLGSTGMSRLFPGLLQTLGLLRQQMWLWSSWSLLYMSSASRRWVIWFRITSRRAIQGGKLDGSIMYHILL